MSCTAECTSIRVLSEGRLGEHLAQPRQQRLRLILGRAVEVLDHELGREHVDVERGSDAPAARSVGT